MREKVKGSMLIADTIHDQVKKFADQNDWHCERLNRYNLDDTTCTVIIEDWRGRYKSDENSIQIHYLGELLHIIIEDNRRPIHTEVHSIFYHDPQLMRKVMSIINNRMKSWLN